MFITNFEPRGNILLDKNRTAIGKDSSFSEKRYSARTFTFMFLLLVARTFSQAFTKFENRVESLADGMQIHLLLFQRFIISWFIKNKLVNMPAMVSKDDCEIIYIEAHLLVHWQIHSSRASEIICNWRG
jgi:hypothetical protein